MKRRLLFGLLGCVAVAVFFASVDIGSTASAKVKPKPEQPDCLSCPTDFGYDVLPPPNCTEATGSAVCWTEYDPDDPDKECSDAKCDIHSGACGAAIGVEFRGCDGNTFKC